MKKTIRILFIAPHRPERSPSQRFRIEQFFNTIKSKGYTYDYSWLISEKEDAQFYANGYFITKVFLIIKYFLKRCIDVYNANNYDIIFIQREAFFMGPPIFEYLFHKSSAKIIYDFDDSIWLPNVSDGNKKFDKFKYYNKIYKIISYADLVIAGNSYLASYANHFNKNVVIISTVVDTDKYTAIYPKENASKICIGWSGSSTTIKHFKYAEEFLNLLKNKYRDNIIIKVVGDASYKNEALDIKGSSWSKETEVEELNSIDIGIMPLPNDDWSKGKCGLKGLLYMSMGIPAVMSPVGVNNEILKNGINGFLAESDNEWLDKLSLLIDSEELRKKIGAEGLKTVEERYSLNSQKSFFIKCIESLVC